MDGLVLQIGAGADRNEAESLICGAGRDKWGCGSSAGKEGSDESLGEHIDYFLGLVLL